MLTCGNANVSTVLSMEMRSTGSTTTASASHSRGPALCDLLGRRTSVVVMTSTIPAGRYSFEPRECDLGRYASAMPATESSTRDRLLDAFETLLVTAGSRSATLDAVASAADVSKGGLLYHFPSKDALVEGMLDRLRTRGAEDAERMSTAKQGPVEFYLETSVDTGSD